MEFRRIIPSNITNVSMKEFFVPEPEYQGSPLEWFTIVDNVILGYKGNTNEHVNLPVKISLEEKSYSAYPVVPLTAEGNRLPIFRTGIGQSFNYGGCHFVFGTENSDGSTGTLDINNDSGVPDLDTFATIRSIGFIWAEGNATTRFADYASRTVFAFPIKDRVLGEINRNQFINLMRNGVEFSGWDVSAGEYPLKATANAYFLAGISPRSVYIPKDFDLSGVLSFVFMSCNTLKEIEFHEDAPLWGGRLVSQCRSLQKIILPKSITDMNKLALNPSQLPILEELYIPTTTPPIVDSSLLVNVTRIYVPESAVNTYKNATNWTTYANKIIGY